MMLTVTSPHRRLIRSSSINSKSIPGSVGVTCWTAVLIAYIVVAQDPTPGQVDPAATCPYQIADQIQQCRAQVYADEAALPGGPCHDGQWDCICNLQQGLIACYSPCPGTTPQTDIDYNNANCNGQNGVVNAAASPGGAEYSGSLLTTIGGDGATGATAATATSEITTATDAAITTSSTPDTTSTTPSTSSAAQESPTVTNASNSPSSASVKTPVAPAQSISGNVFDGSKPGAGNKLVVLQGSVQGGLLLFGMLILAVVQLF